jgi:hypothetical protein
MKTSRFVLFKEIIAVYSENHNETRKCTVWRNAEFLKVKASGIYSYNASDGVEFSV